MREIPEEVLSTFDGIFKGRKAKGLENWKKFEQLSAKVQGKTQKDIAFTCSHPSHGEEGSRHVLGSRDGNEHFLLGYGNPAFHLADYHWSLIDPYGEDTNRPHPSNPQYWKDSGLPLEAEGDLSDGKAHPSAGPAVKRQRDKTNLKNEMVRGVNGFSTFVGVPSKQIIYEVKTNRIYQWDLAKNSYFAAANPDFVEAMDAGASKDPVTLETDQPVRGVEKGLLDRCVPGQWGDVYPLVKSLFPDPGTLMPLPGTQLLAVTTPESVNFYTNAGEEASVLIYDRVYKSVDLQVNSDVMPAVVLNLALAFTDVDIDKLNAYQAPLFVKGHPTPGFEEYEGSIEDNPNRTVVEVDGVLRVEL